MEKKFYIQPAMQCYGVNVVTVICGSGTSSDNITTGSEDDKPTSSTQGDYTGIFGESKGSEWDGGDE